MRLRVFVFLVLCVTSGACTAPTEDWSDPAWVDLRLESLDPRAFTEFTNLTAEQQVALVPTLVEVYNGGLRQQDALRALVSAADPRGKDVFLAALDRPDDELAGLGARGLAAINDTASAAVVARRLSTVTQHDAYPAFLDSLRAIPTPEAGDVVAQLMVRPAARIGGINTVRQGCHMLGAVENPSEQVLNGLAFALINFIPAPPQDAVSECELALIKHGDRAVPALQALLAGTNQEVNTHLRSLQLPDSVGRLRGGAVLAHLGTPAATAALIEWFGTSQELPRQELARMDIAAQQAWYSQQGQLFTLGIEGLAIAGTDDALATLRLLENSEIEDSKLTNFQQWFTLSNGAEFGLRTSVQEALSQVGTDADRELLWERATSGSVTRGGAAFTRELRANALHFLGRGARPGDMARYEAVLAAQEDASFMSAHRVYFVMAEMCGDDAACFASKLDDTSSLLEEESLAAMIAATPEGPNRNMATQNVSGNARTGAVWQIATRLDQSTLLLDRLAHDSTQVRFNIGRALLVTPTLPADASAKIDAFIEADSGNSAGAARDIRHGYRLVKAIRS